MATATNPSMDSTKFLLLGSKSITESIKWPVIMLFTQLIEFIKCVSENIQSTDTFVLIVPGGIIKEVLNDPIYKFKQVRHIYVYYDNDNDLKRDKDHIKDELGKFRFCHERKLATLIEKLKADNAVDSSEPNYHETANNFLSSLGQYVTVKRSRASSRHSPEPKRFTSTTKHGITVKNIEQIDSHYICSTCKSLFRDPYQLECGHRICQCCIKNENGQTPCLTCFHISLNTNIRPDRGFRNAMEQLPITCSGCDWTGPFKTYQKHIDQKHPDRENTGAIVDVYTQRTDQNRLGEFVQTAETRQQIMSDIFSASRSISVPDNSNVINNRYHFLFTHLQEMIDTISSRVNIVFNNQQRLNTEIQCSQTLLQVVNQNLLSLKASFENIVSCAHRSKDIEDLLAEEISLLKQAVHDALFTSFDGTYIWKITGVQEKIMDAQSERQRSIYSPPFYSSPTGYKMCLRLYLNGDSDARDEHLSLFLVIMRNGYDAILEWPFSYKVTFRLIDQSAPNHHSGDIIGSFLPDIRSNCFQRPKYSMNPGYGLKEFLSVAEFEQNQGRFVKDDTMFIEAKIDFLSQQSVLSSTSSTGGSPNDEEHVDTISENFMYMS